MIKLIKRVLNLSGKYKAKILSASIFSFLKAILSKMPIYMAFVVLWKFYSNTIEVKDCIIIFIVLVFGVIFEALFQLISDRLQSATGYMMFADKRIELGSHLRKLPMGYFTEGNIGKVSSVLSTDMIFIEENVMSVIADFMSHVFTIVIMTAFMFFIDIRIGLVTLGITVLVIILGEKMNKLSLRKSVDRQEQSEKLTDSVLSFVEGMSVIKSFNLLGEKSAELTGNFKKTRDKSLQFEEELAPKQRTLNIIYGIGISVIILLAIYLQQNNMLNVTYVLGLLLFVFDIFGPLKVFYGEAVRFAVMNSCLDRIEELFNETELNDVGTERIPSVAKDNVEVEFNNVNFAYNDKNVIDNISFKVKRNSMVALVGPSGGGKSTIANLLVRFWDVKSGSVKVRGKDIRNIPVVELMKNISMVFQRVYLFQDTIYNNIKMGKSDATKEEIYEAAKKARCYDFIMNLPNGFDTTIGEGGATLSGGEKQRISIARCILKDAPIIILDEATASIDADNESYIQEAIADLVRGKTLIVIAHRLNTIKSADEIIVISEGKVNECGNHDELMKKNGVYKEYVTIRKQGVDWSIC